MLKNVIIKLSKEKSGNITEAIMNYYTEILRNTDWDYLIHTTDLDTAVDNVINTIFNAAEIAIPNNTVCTTRLGLLDQSVRLLENDYGYVIKLSEQIMKVIGQIIVRCEINVLVSLEQPRTST
jgi:hypothetical protein